MNSNSSKRNEASLKKLLWLEDQYEDLMDYSSRLGRNDFLVDPVRSVSEALKKLKTEKYDIYIFDLKVLPGDDPEWLKIDETKRKEDILHDPCLGLRLLQVLDKNRKENTQLWKEIGFDFKKVIIFSVVNNKKVYDELESFGIPPKQIVNKSGIDLDTLPKLIMEIQKENSNGIKNQ